MKVFGFLCLFLLIGTSACMYFGYSSKGLNPGVGSIENNDVTWIFKSRKLKEFVGPNEDEHVHLEDYRRIDPAPSSKAWIRPGPIQHGTPLQPFIPKTSPPPPGSQPKQGG
ncbi:hypothetical protein CASFOL_038222 [Castilleja foliolosa]|uniref:Uncharacterized protein n=1 Tax=Castilleja foliolosa TaxID=1961234 RepID=A0ABD3BKD6_9LAMI